MTNDNDIYSYKKTLVLTGDKVRAMNIAETVLTANGFKLEVVSPGEIVASLRVIISSRQNPLRGISGIHLSVKGNQLQVDAELGGVLLLRRFMLVFPLALGGGLVLLFLALSLIIPVFPLWSALIPLLAVSPWPLLTPFLTGVFRTRTVNELEAMLSNMNAVDMQKQ